MESVVPGWAVERAIPTDVLAGLFTGQYKLHGGVIRWATGTDNAGQIVRHLLPVATNVASIASGDPIAITGAIGSTALKLGNVAQHGKLASQVDALTATTQQILQLSLGTMVLAGLNLAVSAVGFSVLNAKLTKLEGKLNEIHADIKEIKEILQQAERAKLRSALRDLLKINGTTNPEHRHTMLHEARKDLGEINERYIELYPNAHSLESAIAYEEYFCITALARVRCTAELGMIEIARKELTEADQFWKRHSRELAKEKLLGNDPERFLASDFAAEVPVITVADWLDFAYEEDKGIGWIDELRQKTQPLYDTSFIPSISFRRGGIGDQRVKIIPLLQKLANRNVVFDGYEAQYKIMEESALLPSEFDRQLEETNEDLTTDGFLILKPAEKELLDTKK